MLRPLSRPASLFLFGLPSAWFIVVAYAIIPRLTGAGVHPAMAWFIGGTAVFAPLFFAALTLSYQEGYRGWGALRERLRLRPLSRSDWRTIGVAALVIGAGTGIVMGGAELLHRVAGTPAMESSPPFMQIEPFAPSERWMLLVWCVMFFFNILGEELLWRGYILPRQEASEGGRAWAFNAAGWMLFHLCFGPALMLTLLPIIIVLPYAVQRTGNTTVGVALHALLNGPAFILIVLGVIG